MGQSPTGPEWGRTRLRLLTTRWSHARRDLAIFKKEQTMQTRSTLAALAVVVMMACSQPGPAPTSPSPGMERMAARDLAIAYHRDESAASARYDGAWVRVHGPVTEIDSVLERFLLEIDEPCTGVEECAGMYGNTVTAIFMGPNGRRAEEVGVGESVTVTCRSEGMALGLVSLGNCEIVEE